MKKIPAREIGARHFRSTAAKECIIEEEQIKFLADIGDRDPLTLEPDHNVGSITDPFIDDLTILSPSWIGERAWEDELPFCADKYQQFVCTLDPEHDLEAVALLTASCLIFPHPECVCLIDPTVPLCWPLLWDIREGPWEWRCCDEPEGDGCQLWPWQGTRKNGRFWLHNEGDFDGDGIDNGIDLCPMWPAVYGAPNHSDFDGDFFGYECDNCTQVGNSNQADWDWDGYGDVCDNCRSIPNDQTNSDSDPWGDDCDLCKTQDPRCIGRVCPDIGFTEPLIYGDGPHNVMEDVAEYLNTMTGEVIDMREINDIDGDELGNLCDNCRVIPNKDQWNCNGTWELSTRPGYEFAHLNVPHDFRGDACDPDPCVDFDNDVTITYLAGDGLVDMKMRSVGYREGMMPNLVYKDVMKGYCNCYEIWGRMPSDFDRCRRDHYCYERYRNTPEWQSMSLYKDFRDDGELYHRGENIPGVEFRRLYLGAGEERSCRESDWIGWGCHSSDASAFYNSDYGLPSVYQMTWYWDWFEDFGYPDCSPPAFCKAGLWFFFKPTDEGRLMIDGWPIEKNAYYSPEIYRLLEIRVGGSSPDRIPDDLLWGFTERYLDFGERGCPSRLEDILSDDFYLVADLIKRGCPMDEFEKWGYADAKPTSASTGMIIGKFSFERGTYERFYRSVFENSDDIIDVTGVAVAHQKAGGQSGYSSGGAGDFNPVSTLGSLWVFGGKDLAGYRNDLWLGTPYLIQDNETVFTWQRILPVQHDDGAVMPEDGEEAAYPSVPPPREGATLVCGCDGSSLILFGGWNDQGVFNDLWGYNMYDNTWELREPSGSVPSLNPGYLSVRYGNEIYFLDTDGAGVSGQAPAHSLYTYNTDTNYFSAIQTAAGPPGISGGSMTYDVKNGGLYVFGGYDGESYHNYLWYLDPSNGAWSMMEPDCGFGICPELSYQPLIVVSSGGWRIAIIPGQYLSDEPVKFLEPFYTRKYGEWYGGWYEANTENAGDCNGDGTVDEGYGLLCKNHDAWYIKPGMNVCDSFEREIVCNQKEPPAAETGSRHLGGVKSLVSKNNVLFMARNRKVVSVDVSDIHSPRVIDRINIHAPIRDMEILRNTLVVAADAGLFIIEVDENSTGEMELVSEVPCCGRPLAVEMNGAHALFLTPLGIGEVDLSDPGAPELIRFSWIIRYSREDWELVPVDVSLCGYISEMAGFFCDLLGCWGGHERPFDITGDKAYLTYLNDMLIIDTSQDEDFTVNGFFHLPRMAKKMKYYRGFVYLNLRGRQTAVVDVGDPSSPSPSGTHDLADWVKGVEFETGRAYRIVPGGIEWAAWEGSL